MIKSLIALNIKSLIEQLWINYTFIEADHSIMLSNHSVDSLGSTRLQSPPHRLVH